MELVAGIMSVTCEIFDIMATTVVKDNPAVHFALDLPSQMRKRIASPISKAMEVARLAI